MVTIMELDIGEIGTMTINIPILIMVHQDVEDVK
jgi:hypothetical protein